MSSNDSVVVFGGSGRLGRRIVCELANQEYSVYVGCRNIPRTKQLIVEREPHLKESTLLQYFEANVNKSDNWFLNKTNVQAVVAVIGANENLWNLLQPYQIDYLGNKRIIEATKSWKPNCHFVLVTSLGTGKPFTGFPAAFLNLFGGILYWKHKSEQYLINSQLPFTIIRPGGMERPKDDFGKTHQGRLWPADTQFNGLVSRLQVAQLTTQIIQKPSLSIGKIVEVTTIYQGVEIPLEEQLKRIPVWNQKN
eukprot:jgi/Galph1/584/GphlegSOOS_G5397.1